MLNASFEPLSVVAQRRALCLVLAEKAAGLAPAAPEVRSLESEERRITESRLKAIRLRDERERMVRAQQVGVAEVGPHAHLTHRRTPIASSERGRRW